MQPITTLGVTELTQDEMADLIGGDDSCWCSGFKQLLGYGIGYVVGELVDALIRPEDSNSFLGK